MNGGRCFVFAICVVLSACAPQTKSHVPATPAPVLLPRATVRKVERVIDAVAGSERNFDRKVELGEHVWEKTYEEMAECREILFRAMTVKIREGEKQHTYTWKPAERRLVPSVKEFPWLHVAVEAAEGANGGIKIEVGDLGTGVFEFEMLGERRRLYCGGRLNFEPVFPPSLWERIWHPSLW